MVPVRVMRKEARFKTFGGVGWVHKMTLGATQRDGRRGLSSAHVTAKIFNLPTPAGTFVFLSVSGRFLSIYASLRHELYLAIIALCLRLYVSRVLDDRDELSFPMSGVTISS